MRIDWMRVDFAGICAVILATGLSLGWCGALLFVAFRGLPLGEQGIYLLSTLGGTMGGAVATYLGSKIKVGPPEQNDVAKV